VSFKNVLVECRTNTSKATCNQFAHKVTITTYPDSP